MDRVTLGGMQTNNDTEEFSFTNIKNMEIESIDADIRIRQEKDNDERIEVVLEGNKIDTINVEPVGDSLFIVQDTNRDVTNLLRNVTVNITIYADGNWVDSILISSTSATIDIQNVYTDYLNVSNMSGDINISGSSSSTLVSVNYSGITNFSDVSSNEIFAKSLNGAIRFEDVVCEILESNTVRGNQILQFNELDEADLTIKSISGNIDLIFSGMQEINNTNSANVRGDFEFDSNSTNTLNVGSSGIITVNRNASDK